MSGPAALVAGAVAALVAATSELPAWLDSVSRVGVVGVLVFAGFALHRKWWVPGWTYRELEERHAKLRERYDAAIDLALRSSRSVEKSATLLESAIARGLSTKGEG